MTIYVQMKLAGSLAAVGFVAAVACAIVYFMRLPIFSEATVSWVFVAGLIAMAVGTLALILRAIWDGPS